MALNKASAALHVIKQPHSGGSDSSSETYWVPNTDVYATDAGLVIKVELAGMRKENLELSVEGSRQNRLKIAGLRVDGCREPKCTFLVMEINYGAFESMIELPPGYDLTRAKATYQLGFLRIDVPKQPEGPQKSLSVSIVPEEH